MLKYKEIIFASHNQGKIAEIREILNPYGIKVLSAADLELPDVEETGKTFEENAYIKAKANDQKYTTKIVYKDNLLPVKKGDIVATLTVLCDDKEITSYNLYSDNDVEKATYFSKLIKTFKLLF